MKYQIIQRQEKDKEQKRMENRKKRGRRETYDEGRGGLIEGLGEEGDTREGTKGRSKTDGEEAGLTGGLEVKARTAEEKHEEQMVKERD